MRRRWHGDGQTHLLLPGGLVCPFFQNAAEPLNFMFESAHRLRGLFKVPLAGDFFQVEGGLEGRLRREVSHRAFQSVDEALQVMTLHLLDGVVNGLHLLGKVV